MPLYYCVAYVHRGRVSGWLSCTRRHDKAKRHLKTLKSRGVPNVEIVRRSAKPRGVKAPR